jgi:hypothetical protein
MESRAIRSAPAGPAGNSAIYVLDGDVDLRFPDTPSPDWLFIYTGGLLTDARHRVRSR